MTHLTNVIFSDSSIVYEDTIRNQDGLTIILHRTKITCKNYNIFKFSKPMF